MVRSAYEWPWSSYRGTAGLTQAPEFLTTDWILGGFGDNRQSAQKAYRQYVSEGKGQPSPWERLKNQIYLGSDEFVEAMQCKMNPEQSLEDIPKPQKQLPVRPLLYFEETYRTRNRAMAEAYRSRDFLAPIDFPVWGMSHNSIRSDKGELYRQKSN